MILRINKFLPFTKVEGPGNRACIWVQGCNIHCSGCSTPWLWPLESGIEIDVNEIILNILELDNVEGVTFSGGEPFLQAKQLAKIGQKLKKERDFSVITYSGYYLDQLKNVKNKDYNDLLSATDILIDGPYIENLPTKLPLIGSSNQNIHFLTSRYLDIKEKIIESPKKIEFQILPDSTVMANGNIDPEFIKDILNGMIIKKE